MVRIVAQRVLASRRDCPVSTRHCVHAIQQCIEIADIQIVKGGHVIIRQRSRAIQSGGLQMQKQYYICELWAGA